jgi:hypothetical protein
LQAASASAAKAAKMSGDFIGSPSQGKTIIRIPADQCDPILPLGEPHERPKRHDRDDEAAGPCGYRRPMSREKPRPQGMMMSTTPQARLIQSCTLILMRHEVSIAIETSFPVTSA